MVKVSVGTDRKVERRESRAPSCWHSVRETLFVCCGEVGQGGVSEAYNFPSGSSCSSTTGSCLRANKGVANFTTKPDALNIP